MLARALSLPSPTCEPPGSPPVPALCFPRDFPAPALPASRREPRKTRRTGPTRPETRSGAPQDWRGALAPLRMCALRAAGVSRYTSLRAPSTQLGLRHNTGRGKFPKPRENAPAYPPRGRLGVRPTSRGAGAPTGVRPVRLSGRGRLGRTGPARRGGAVGAWRGVAGGGRPGTLTHAPGRLPVALPSLVLS